MPDSEPVHPGLILRERFLELVGLTCGQVARAIGVLPDSVRRIAQEEMQLSAKMAQRLGRYFGNGADYWAGLHTQFDLAIAVRKLAGDRRKITPFGQKQPQEIGFW